MGLFVADDGASAPRTHALIIGIGGYPYLQDGADPRDQLVDNVGLLGQLTSPPRSALAVATWLRDNAGRLRAPLGSIELLYSVAPADAFGAPPNVPAGASLREIKQAYAGWRGRCHRHEDNVAIFYFCGHGLEKNEQYLLAEDFGENSLNPWDGAFGIDSTRLAFNACKARTQCFFIDACRKLTSAMLTHRVDVPGLEPFDVTIPECEHSLTAKAAAHVEPALGPPGEVSFFAQALLSALDGSAAGQYGGRWAVGTCDIVAHIGEIMAMVRGPQVPGGRPVCTNTGGAALVQVANPVVSVMLSCSPTDANGTATLSWAGVGKVAAPAQKTGGPWEFQAPPGQYIAGATFPDASYVPAEMEVMAMPPRQVCNLQCAP